MNAKATAAVCLAALAVTVGGALGVPLPPDVRTFAALASSLALIAYGTRIRGRFVLVGKRLPRAAVDSDGWRKDTFVMDGLEEEGLELKESTEAAEAHGYRREPTSDRHSWRFVREAKSQ